MAYLTLTGSPPGLIANAVDGLCSGTYVFDRNDQTLELLGAASSERRQDT